jgi:hypothetical protein
MYFNATCTEQNLGRVLGKSVTGDQRLVYIVLYLCAKHTAA